MATASRQLREVLSILDGFAANTAHFFAPELQLAKELCADLHLRALQREAEQKHLKLQPTGLGSHQVGQLGAGRGRGRGLAAAGRAVAMETSARGSARASGAGRGRGRGPGRGRGQGRIAAAANVESQQPTVDTDATTMPAVDTNPSAMPVAAVCESNQAPPLSRACFITPAARQVSPAATPALAYADEIEEDGGTGDFVLHVDGEGEGNLELQERGSVEQKQGEEGEQHGGVGEGDPRKRRKKGNSRPFSTARAVMDQMEAVRAQGPAVLQPSQGQDRVAAGYRAEAQQLVALEGELTAEQWAKEIQMRACSLFTHQASYIRSNAGHILSTNPNQFRVASYWDAAAKGEEGGFGAFQLDAHMSSAATGRECPPGCPHCSKQPPTPKWSRQQHLANTLGSLGFFDRADHAAPITTALQSGHLQQTASSEQLSIAGHSLHPTLDLWHMKYLFGTVHSMETERTINKVRMSRGAHTSQMTTQRQVLAISKPRDQLHVTDSKWADWRAKANEQAAQRKATPAGGQFAAMLEAAHASAKSGSSRGRKRGRGQAGQLAMEAVQRRDHDPAARRVSLVQAMRYLPLKKAALLGLLQQQLAASAEQQPQQEQHQQQQQQQQKAAAEADRVRRLDLADVTAELLDARWSTEQLETAASVAAAAASEMKAQKDLAKSVRQKAAADQQQQQQQGQQQQEPEPLQPPRPARQCTLVPQRPLYKESHKDNSSNNDSEESGDESSSESDSE